ncbi:hypothetical protein [Granulibacter bethesdensis]|uniref:hypothetical protein n=1 Tax=Granulibacter bethesdensis TaxID=364410 RepID=UPI0003F1DC27|nr:hypothetical protein [Granulibacter bethesdensis]AHJ69340.1 Hypothetical protein GbCGDNIH2_7289 [Granulibacter bethesdensis]
MLTVIVPPNGRRLIAPGVVQTELRALDTELAAIERLVDQASQAICSACHRVFGRRTVTETFRAAAPLPMLLSVTLLASIQSVMLDGVLMDESEYDIDLAAGMLEIHRCGRVAVTYTAGWILPDDPAFGSVSYDDQLPGDVQRAALVTVASYWHARGRDPLLRSHSTDGVSSISLLSTVQGTALPQEAASLLARYEVHAS